MKICSSRDMLYLVWLALALIFMGGCVTSPASVVAALPEVRDLLLEYPCCTDQVTGIAVSSQERIFVNFPRWGKDPLYSVAEMLPDGSLHPYPDNEWSRRGRAEARHPEAHFISVQSVVVDNNDTLWVLDPASPDFKGVVSGGAKLVGINLTTGAVERVIRFDDAVAPPSSYLNDVRFDPEGETAYITDSGLGALIVLDLASGKSRRRLTEHYSTKAEPGYVPVIGGRELRDQNNQVPQIHADGIALDSDGEYLYYHALTGRTLYRIRTAALKDPKLSEKQLADHVEKVAETGATDGMLFDPEGSALYLTALEHNAIKRYNIESGVLDTIIQADTLQWPDSMAISPDGDLYITASQIHRMPRFNSGKDGRVLPYKYFKYSLAFIE